MCPSKYVSVVLGLIVCSAMAPAALSFVTPGTISLSAQKHLTSSSKGRIAAARTTRRMAAEEAEEVETDEGKKKTKPPAWMFNDQGVAYAPWMVDAFDPENLAKTAAAIEERKRREAEMVPESTGALARDPQQMELSGTGLAAKRDGDSVELQWATGDEKNNKGFIISRRVAKTDNWEEIASYETYPPLNSKGPQGGRYAYLDEGVEEGTYVYRVSDISNTGMKSDLCQTVIELQSSAEELQSKIGVAGLVILLLAAAAAGVLYDPAQ